jgi:superfamily I DNA/RNA helicase
MNATSEEQTIVLNNTKSGHNSVVDAVAGSGKSTTILSIAAKMVSKKFIQFTYNSMLRHEIKEKTDQLNISNLDIHTYHSLAVKYYNSSAYTDTGIRHILTHNTPPRIHIPKKDVVVIDEAQDMTFLYFLFIVKYTMDMNHPFQLIVLGDYMQGLYDFKGADTRFLTMAIEIWKHHPNLKSPTFHNCSLKTSYRITNQMASFINEVMLAEIVY